MLVLRGRTSAINKPDDKSDIDSVLHSNLMLKVAKSIYPEVQHCPQGLLVFKYGDEVARKYF